MGTKERILTIRLIEKAIANPDFAKALGIVYSTKSVKHPQNPAVTERRSP